MPISIVLLIIICYTNPVVTTFIPARAWTLSHTDYTATAANTAVLTYKYDNLRTGQTTTETILNPSNVNAAQFGKRISYPVDGQVYAQPLYVPNLMINSQPRNVVFIATEHDSVYAFDADASNAITGQIWHTSFLTNGALTPTNRDVACNDTIPEMGITGTPVIDLSTQTMYVVTFTKEQGEFIDRLHALDITNGHDRAAILISASVTNGGQFSASGPVIFNARRERQRAALLLANGQVYVAWGSFCDDHPYHGWIMSYSFDGTVLHLTGAFNATPDASEGGFWGSGGAISADKDGNVYAISGNGIFNVNSGGTAFSDSIVKLSPALRLLDYFTPFNQACISHVDADLGSSGPLLEPDHDVLVAAGKEGRIYVLNRSSLGHYHALNNACKNQKRTTVDDVLQESPPGHIGGLFNTPSYWNGYVYLASVNRPTGAYPLTSSGLFRSFTPLSQTPESFGFSGGNLVISSNGTSAGILWTVDRGDTRGAALRAYDATDLRHELYNSNQNADRDALDGFVKFTCPIVANGEVFVPTSISLDIYGEVSPSTPPPPVSYNNTGISDDSYAGHMLANFDGRGYSYSSGALQAAGITPGSSLLSSGLAFIWPNLPASARDNYQANHQTIPLIPVMNATTLAFLGSSTNGNTSGNATIHYTDGSSQNFTLGLTDWTSTTPAFGNTVIATMDYRNGPNGKQALKVALFSAQVTLQSGKTLKSVTLPSAPAGPNRLHVFVMTTSGPWGSYNNIGTSDDNAPRAGNFDGLGDSYSAQALQVDGCNPGDNAFFGGSHGTVFQWPGGISGEPNNIIAAGQTVPVNALNNAHVLAFAGASAGGPASGIATINYSDGSKQTFRLGLSDWTLNNGQARPSFGNQIMYKMPYHNTLYGHTLVTTYVFFTSITLQPHKTVQSVTLPATGDTEQIHIFAISTRAASSQK